MPVDDVLTICRHLKNNSIPLSPNNLWLLECIDWYKSQNYVVSSQELQEYVCNQWLLADLHDIQEACLPTINNQDVCRKLTGKYSVQVNWIRDIGQSSYSQLKNLQISNESESNEALTLEKPEKWEPRPSRTYMLEITDGVTTLRAMEYTRINKLQEPFIPGTKILISGPLECRRGVLLLQENNVTVLGGEVFSLLIPNSTENVLARSLNLEEQSVEQPMENSDNQRHIPTRIQNLVSASRSMNYRDTTPTTNYSNNDHFISNTTEQMDLLASDEDEALLLQIHTEALQSDDEPNQNINHIDTSTNSHVSNEPNYNFKRPFSRYSNGIATNVNERIESESVVSRPSFRNDNELPRNYQSNITEAETPLSEVNQLPSGSRDSMYSSEQNSTFDDDDDEIFASLEEEPQFPYCKQMEAAVQSLTSKLKIRDGEWTITAKISDGKNSFDVGFSSEVLEEIFGFSAAEVQAKRGEMASNPAIKEKVNAMLKTGQQKLKSMKCPMTIEFPSASESPRVVTVEL